MQMVAGSPFETASPHQAIAVLLLVENSQPMSFIWPDLRDLYLTKLVDNIEKTNAPTPIISLVLESYPSQGTPSSFPRQYNGLHEGLRDLRFNGSPDNKLSAAKISSGIDCLISLESEGRPAALHLIIVAARTPSDDSMGGGNNFSLWLLLAQKMAHANIRCHVVMSPNEDMTSLSVLFEETARLQSAVEGYPPFPIDRSQVTCRLSVQPSHHQFYPDGALAHNRPQRITIPRRNTFPLDGQYAESLELLDESAPPPSACVESENAPSLVTQLQQKHGLTKKKVYGAKPVRPSFFREERVRDRHRKIPAPLTMPMPLQHPELTQSGRAVSRSRAERMLRVGQGSPTELHPRRQLGYARRGSRFPSPEDDVGGAGPGPISSPASITTFNEMSPASSYDYPSPVSPTGDDYYGVPSTPHNSTPIVPMTLTPLHGGGSPGDPAWLQQPQTYTPGCASSGAPLSMSYFPVTSQPLYPSNLHQYCDPDPQAPQMVLQSQERQHLPQQPTTSLPPPQIPPQQLQPQHQHQHQQTMALSSYPHLSYPTPQPIESNIVQSVLQGNIYANPPFPSSAGGVEVTNGLHTQPQPPAPVSEREPIRPPLKKSRSYAEEDEIPFTFGKEYVAATTALFEQEVLPCYPDYPALGQPVKAVAPDDPKEPSNPTTAQTALSPCRGGLYINGSDSPPVQQVGGLYASRGRPDAPLPPAPVQQLSEGGEPQYYAHSQLQPPLTYVNMEHKPPAQCTLAYSTTFSPGTSSSLTGWAG